MIKVVQFVHGLNMGGAETIVKNYAIGLDKEKFSVSILCYERYDSKYETILDEAGIPVIYVCDEMPKVLEGKKNLLLRMLRRLIRCILIRKHLRAMDPDVVHFHLDLHSYIRFARLKRNVRMVYTHHYAIEHWPKRDIANAIWIKNRYSYHPIALSDKMRDDMDRILKTNNTVVVNNGVDLSRFANTKKREQMRSELGIAHDAFVMIHVGRFDVVKNHTFLVDVFAQVQKTRKNSVLVMIGAGSQDEKDAVKRRLEGYGLAERYMILTDRTDIPDLLRMADVFVMPSISEGISIAAIEAQVAGLPCVFSDGISPYTKISNLAQFVSLEEPASVWADAAMNGEHELPQYFGLDKWDLDSIIRQIEGIYTEV